MRIKGILTLLLACATLGMAQEADLPRDFFRVVDKTGLTGEYDIRLEYQWAFARFAAPGNSASVPSGAPILFTALQQQLGLRLEKVKTLLEVLVIDRADRTPSEN